jgi:hypothetical protein
MSEIGAWLDRHGLGQHAALFAAQDIDLAVLPALTDRDLKELGLSLGHRRIDRPRNRRRRPGGRRRE